MRDNKVKEWFIRVSKNKAFGKWIISTMIILSVVMIIAAFFDVFFKGAVVCLILGIILLWFYSAIQSIRKYDEDVVRKNNLLHIILSVERTTESYILWILFIVWHLIFVAFHPSVEIKVFLFVIMIVASIKLSKIISKYYKSQIRL